MEPKTTGKIFEGIVVKTAMKDTCTVQVERYVKHPKYKKYIRRSKKFLVHNPGNSVQVGDTVTIRETRPISKMKRFVIASRIAKVEKMEKLEKTEAAE
jgi:small subunit ribosomal protein S17